MRIPRRDFVVEYKTNRRQTKVRSASIWGNVDLKAVARDLESESDLPKTDRHLFDISEQPTVGEPEAPAPDVQSAATQTEDVIAAPLPKEGNTKTPAVAVPDVSLVDGATEQDHVVSAPVSSSKSQARRRANTQVHRARPPVRPTVLDDHRNTPERTGSEEDLLALEAENHHLKHLMVEKLRAENERLRSMLLRFGVR